MVVDTSALLGLFLRENSAFWIAGRLNAAETPRMSSVNYAETLIMIADRRLGSPAEMREIIKTSRIEIIAPNERQAGIAAHGRLRYPLNLGDCFAYALAKEEGLPLLTLDRDFRNCDIEVILPPTSSTPARPRA